MGARTVVTLFRARRTAAPAECAASCACETQWNTTRALTASGSRLLRSLESEFGSKHVREILSHRRSQLPVKPVLTTSSGTPYFFARTLCSAGMLACLGAKCFLRVSVRGGPERACGQIPEHHHTTSFAASHRATSRSVAPSHMRARTTSTALHSL